MRLLNAKLNPKIKPNLDTKRRAFLGVMMTASVSILLLPMKAVAAIWNKAAFEAIRINQAQKDLGVSDELPSQEIEIVAPDRAENGAIVQVEIKSRIPQTEAIAIFVDKNPTALIGNYMFTNGTLPQIITRIKMAETSDIKIVVKAGDKYYSNTKNVVVLENGCG
jgi:sulfur-oxidizing protein SoxY